MTNSEDPDQTAPQGLKDISRLDMRVGSMSSLIRVFTVKSVLSVLILRFLP